MGEAWDTHGIEMCVEFWWEHLMERKQLEDLGVDGIILRE